MIHSIKIQSNSKVPKYKQLISIFREGIQSRSIPTDQQLPSINHLSASLDVSRDTVEKAYRELRKKDLVEAVPGKGYFVKKPNSAEKLRVLLLFNKLSAHKRVIYERLIQLLNKIAEVDFYIYNNDVNQFGNLLDQKLDSYAYYVIIPHFYDKYHDALALIDRIPKQKLVLLDKRIRGIGGEYACVYQDFEKNIYEALQQLKDRIKKYRSIKLVFPSWTYQPREIVNGFQRFCIEEQLQGTLVPDINKANLQPGDVYITMMEDDLISLIKQTKNLGLKVGSEIGIISYNENPLKEILLDGITVISTDFELLGETAASMILSNEKSIRENPFRVIIRNSL
ncbi:MAG: GntR family transcriptional regulator [Saprospiraceae bacterium]|nr:GntR family transcriptional regulator [Saprospiraceae bacterium]